MENRNFEYMDTEKEKQMLKDLKGYLYWKDRQKRNSLGDVRTYWRCVFFQQGPNGEKESTCNARGVLYNDVFTLSQNNTHNHEPYQDAVVLKKFEGRVRQMAKDNTDASARTLFERAIIEQDQETPNYVLGEINDGPVMRNMRRYRKITLEEPPIPNSIDGLIIPDLYYTHKNEVIVKFEGYDPVENNRYIILSTEQLLNKLRDYPQWGADGTFFDVVRGLFRQLWIIFARIGTAFVPCAFCFMSRTTQNAYHFVLTQIRKMRPTAVPSSIATDFELAEMNAFQLLYPAIQYKACFFHFTKNLFKRVVGAGLQERYNYEHGFAHQVKMIFALPFVPVTDLDRAFDTLYNITDGALEGILKSVERTYYGQIEDEIRSIPRYPPEKWNLFERVKNSEPRSSNGIEAYNNQLVRKAVEARPNIWHWIRIIKEEMALAEQKIDEFEAGQPTQRRRSNYRIMDDRLRETVLRYDKMPLEDFIRNIANHLRLDTII
ncbi:MULE transposase domain-containing protein [Ditylenchus destructor]|nr:MULE transposase domain-containing protein [Ditylenchus destructor]